MTLLRAEPNEPKKAAALLGAGLYLGGAVVVAATAPLLPHDINRTPLFVSAVIAAVAALVVPLLPWERWPRATTAVLPLGGYLMFAIAGSASPGALLTYIPLYSLTFLYLGLTQTPTTAALGLPIAAVSLLIGTGGTRASAVTVAIAAPVWLLIGTVVATVLQRQRHAEESTEKLLGAAVALGHASSESEAADLVAALADSLLSADMTLVALRTDPGSTELTMAASRGLPPDIAPFTLDSRAESDGIAWVLRRGEPLALSDADGHQFVPSPLAKLPVRSSLYLPLPGEDGHLGAVAALWTTRWRLNARMARAAALLSAEAGRTLERVRDAARLTALADTDPVTNVANRRRYKRALDSMRPGDAVVLIDMDHFKTVNDVHGHAAGDEALRELAECMTGVARDSDCVARYGGEEFAMVLTDAGRVGAAAVLERLRREWVARRPVTTFSAGIAIHQAGNGPALTLAMADEALYRAKAAGRDRTEIARPTSAAT